MFESFVGISDQNCERIYERLEGGHVVHDDHSLSELLAEYGITLGEFNRVKDELLTNARFRHESRKAK